MDAQRIQAIRERLQATTPGAWEVCFAEGEKFNPECPKRDPSIFNESDQFIAQTTYDALSETCRPTMYADAVFIAHAKEDIAYLLEWRENLLRQLETAIEIVKKSGEDCFVCDGLRIARDIVEAGSDADIHELMQSILDEFGF